LCALPWFRRPEAWLAALFAAAIIIPACTTRIARGRPYIFTDAVLITILFLWSRRKKINPPAGFHFHRLAPSAASAWIHGSWYLLVPGAAILFAGFWRLAICVTVYAGWREVFMVAALTGHPWEFLFQAVRPCARSLRTFYRQSPIGA